MRRELTAEELLGHYTRMDDAEDARLTRITDALPTVPHVTSAPGYHEGIQKAVDEALTGLPGMTVVKPEDEAETLKRLLN